ncbi:MAG: TSUP family transporter [Lachnospiraceae bacterium]|nr:TSUP family transporter [Lachnospiraceae bacterium]
MEYFWYIIAALGAGIGTGLAGLSAATVMVPILIVLCPSFAGENGAYQATAIALASDVLGSAVTTSTYIKNKNIDLKHGWIMLACILSMCTVGSFAAWKAGNVVLGSFSLFLTFCIGIRFLLKPDTQRKKTISKDAKLGLKGVAISLFFGLTIGFGTGFVGSGGGMMMLVVFTAFLGMELKSAVGTSTFIMTFTALIASVSHILIHPAILFERFDVLVICIVVATVASLISARFANRVDNRTVGLCTGAVLTVLGIFLIILQYRDAIFGSEIIRQILRCFARYLVFIVTAAGLLLIINFTCHPPRTLFRKLLHLPAFASSVVFVYTAESWIGASGASALFALIIYPVLTLLEKWKGYDDLFVQKKPGEVKKSLLLLFFMTAVLIAVCWGALGQTWLAETAILTWGMGDAAAALVGKAIGKHRVKKEDWMPGPVWWIVGHADPKKTWEGSGAMALTAFVICVFCLIKSGIFSVPAAIIAGLIVAPISAVTELVTHDGNDTVTVPVVNMVVLYVMMAVLTA